MTPTTQDHDFALMLDVETASTLPHAKVLQIGYALGNLKTQEIVEHGVFWPHHMPNEGFHEDSDTLTWWGKQDPAVRNRVLNYGGAAGERHSKQFLKGYFTHLVETHPCEIWASPAMFDLPILTYMFGGKPWSYKDERCMMTLYKLIDPRGVLRPADNAMAHDAEQDAIWQLKYLFALNSKLQGMKHAYDNLPEV